MGTGSALVLTTIVWVLHMRCALCVVRCACQAYGEIGLGKSRMMEGGSEPGLIPRALNELFALRRRLGLAMSCCMFEMAGESVRVCPLPL
jgi:hypothetical protein